MMSESEICEVLSDLGHIDHPVSADLRRQMIESLLQHELAIVRYGAVLGLSYLDDPRALPAVERALENETIPSQRRDLEQLRAQLMKGN